MPSANQTILYALPTPTYAAGGVATQPLQNLPNRLFNRWAHLVSVLYRATATPTFSAGAIGPVGTNNVVTKCDFFDGQNLRFQGGFNHLRVMEKLQSGGNRLADSDQGATTVLRTLTRVHNLGPPQMAGAPTDFALPTSLIKSGELRIQFGSFTDVMTPGGTTGTVIVGTLAITAKLVLLDEIRIPPMYQFQSQPTATNDTLVAGRGMYLDVGIFSSNSMQATSVQLTAGAIGNVTVDLGEGYSVTGVDAKDLNLSFNADFTRGDFLANRGEPQSATDTNEKQKNGATPTALVTDDAFLQPVMWTPPDARLSKCLVAANQMRIKWTGTLLPTQICYGRILSQPQNVVAQLVLKAIEGTSAKVLKAPEVRTLSKDKYTGPYSEFMPWKVKVG
jgi:hypothetical protein